MEVGAAARIDTLNNCFYSQSCNYSQATIMHRTITLLMVAVGVLCGVAVASHGEGLRYAMPLVLAAMFSTLTRLNRLDQ